MLFTFSSIEYSSLYRLSLSLPTNHPGKIVLLEQKRNLAGCRFPSQSLSFITQLSGKRTFSRTRPTLSRLWSSNIRRTMLLSYGKFVDRRMFKLGNCEKAGRVTQLQLSGRYGLTEYFSWQTVSERKNASFFPAGSVVELNWMPGEKFVCFRKGGSSVQRCECYILCTWKIGCSPSLVSCLIGCIWVVAIKRIACIFFQSIKTEELISANQHLISYTGRCHLELWKVLFFSSKSFWDFFSLPFSFISVVSEITYFICLLQTFYPTDPFTIFEALKSITQRSWTTYHLRSPDFEDLKLCGRGGRVAATVSGIYHPVLSVRLAESFTLVSYGLIRDSCG